MGAIYTILNKQNGKIYVGQSIEYKKRFAQHKSDLNGGYHDNPHLQSAWNKYGEDSFEFNLLEPCDDEMMNENEVWWIDYFDSTNRDKGYNMESGGNSNYSVSDDTRRRMSENHADFSGENNPMYGKSKELCPFYQKNHSEEVCTHLSNLNNTSGYFRVYKHKSKAVKQGFTWEYRYYVNGKRKSLSSVNLDKLREKVLDKGLIWKKIDKEG